LSFSLDLNKPFTVILGDNTNGKTTIVRAFLWALYGRNDFLKKPLLNKDISDSLPVMEHIEVKVNVDFTHNKISYRMTSRETYTKTLSGSVIIKDKRSAVLTKTSEDGNTFTISDSRQIESEMDSILSIPLTPYFFFDGETNKIDQVTKIGNLKSAVSDIMGLKLLETLSEYFDESRKQSVPAILRQKIKSSDILKANQLENQLNNEKDAKIRLLETITRNEEEISRLDILILAAEEELLANKTTQELQKQKIELENDIKKKKAFINAEFDNITQKFSKNNHLLDSLFSYNFHKFNLKEFLSDSDFLTEKSISHISVEAIDELIQRGYCLCGQTITDKNEAYNHLQDQKDYIAPRNYGKSINAFIDNEVELASMNKNLIERYQDSIKELIKELELYDLLKTRLSEVKNQIIGKKDFGLVQSDLNRYNNQRSQLLGQNKYIKQTELIKIDGNIKYLTTQISKLEADDEINVFYNECLAYSGNISELMIKNLNKNRKEIQLKLEGKVNEIFQKMYHGSRKIVISEDYKVESVLENNDTLDTSMGLNTVINYSFVTGLISLIKEKINHIEDIEIDDFTSDTYPLIIDAPFSNTDEIHIKRICNTITEYSNQVIIAVMSKDFDNASKLISPKIGKMYKLIKDSETQTRIEEVTE
jgi:DNA sulfur modification protein DndD